MVDMSSKWEQMDEERDAWQMPFHLRNFQVKVIAPQLIYDVTSVDNLQPVYQGNNGWQFNFCASCLGDKYGLLIGQTLANSQLVSPCLS